MRESCGGSVMRLTVLVLAAAFLGLAGCKGSWQDPPSTIEQPGNSAIIDLPPRQAMDVAKGTITSPPLNLPIEREQAGTIYTGYQRFPGRWHILRRWQERTRYRVDVTPDFDRPDARSKVEVWEETETRAASNQTWDRSPELRYPARSKKLLEQITAAAQKGPTTSASVR